MAAVWSSPFLGGWSQRRRWSVTATGLLIALLAFILIARFNAVMLLSSPSPSSRAETGPVVTRRECDAEILARTREVTSALSSSPQEGKMDGKKKTSVIRKKKVLCYFVPHYGSEKLWEYVFVAYEMLKGLQNVAVRHVLSGFDWRNTTSIVGSHNTEWMPLFTSTGDFVQSSGQVFDCSQCDYALRFHTAHHASATALFQLQQLCPKVEKYGLIQTSDEGTREEGPDDGQMRDPKLAFYFKQYFRHDRRYTRYPDKFRFIVSGHSSGMPIPASFDQLLLASQRPHFCGFIGSRKKGPRHDMREVAPECFYGKLTPTQTSAYMAQTAVTLAAPGNSPNTFRFSEALMLGSIPIVWDSEKDGWLSGPWPDHPFPRINDTFTQLRPLLEQLRRQQKTGELDELQRRATCYFAKKVREPMLMLARSFRPHPSDNLDEGYDPSRESTLLPLPPYC